MIAATLPGPDASKSAWRSWAKQQWARVDLEATSQAVLGGLLDWRPLQEANTVLLYLPMPGEIDINGLADGRLAGTPALTRTPPDGPLTVHRMDGRMERHPYGFLQPVADVPMIDPGQIDVALVPGRSFDRYGTRLGRGAGYYDVLLAGLAESALVVGVIPNAVVAPRLPSDDHDVAMTHLATEQGVSPVLANC